MIVVAILVVCVGTAAVMRLPARDVRTARLAACWTSGIAWAVSVAAIWVPWEFAPALVGFAGDTAGAALAAAVMGAFFFALLARGLAARAETLSTLILMAVVALGLSTPRLEIFLPVVLAIWALVGMIVRVRGLDAKRYAVRALVVAAAVSIGCLVPAAFLPDSGVKHTLTTAGLMCLLGVFPFHFWMPEVLPSAPFLAATLIPVAWPRLAMAALVRDGAAYGAGGAVSFLGLGGALWCALAGLAARDLRRKVGYAAGVHAALCAWAIGGGHAAEARTFLLAAVPAMALLGIVVSILYDRLKVFEIDRVRGIATHLPRLHAVLVVAMAGVACVPGASTFPALTVLLEQARAPWECGVLAAALLALFLSIGHAYVSICLGEDDGLRAGDLNSRELAALVPLAVFVLTGLWPGLAAFLQAGG